jgi:hypothetical protein
VFREANRGVEGFGSVMLTFQRQQQVSTNSPVPGASVTSAHSRRNQV